MSGTRLVATLAAVAVVFLALFKLDSGSTKENFWMTGNRGWKTFPVVRDPKTGRETAISGNFLDPRLQSQSFVSVPQFQSMLSPRFSNVDYGAHIRYNNADYKNQAVPCDPLTFGDMARENYVQYQRGAPSCRPGGLNKTIPVGGGYELPSNYADGNKNQVLNQLYSESTYPDATDTLPIGTMTTADADGNVTQPVVYDRFMFARPQGRLRAAGDPIRGDLPIVPCQSGWFSVYPNINIDLQEGAMNVLGGVRNETNNKLASLINRASGGADYTIGGVDLQNVNLTPSYDTSLSNALGDVTISAYP